MAGPVQSILDLVPRGHSKSKIIERDGPDRADHQLIIFSSPRQELAESSPRAAGGNAYRVPHFVVQRFGVSYTVRSGIRTERNRSI